VEGLRIGAESGGGNARAPRGLDEWIGLWWAMESEEVGMLGVVGG
jgi:hypothetical protein